MHHDEEEEEEDQEEMSRVTLEALEFDWILSGNNPRTLILILSELGDYSVLSKKPIKMFI